MKPNFDVTSSIPYADNAVTTPISAKVFEAMLTYLQESYGDPDEPYILGEEAADNLAKFRETIAERVGVSSDKLWFTSGGTEGNNWVIQRIARPGLSVCSTVEHLSVLKNCHTHIDVDSNGVLKLDELSQVLASGDISIVSIQHANQETGVIQDIPAIADMCSEAGVPLHVDIAMTFSVIGTDITELGADFMTLSGHKTWGPVGTGAVVSNGKYELNPWLLGGFQEGGMRAGPVNMAVIAGFATAVEELWGMSKGWARIAKMRDVMEERLKQNGVRVIGDKVSRLPNMSCFIVPNSDSAFLAAEMERLYGMCIGIGGAAEPGTSSRVLEAMGLSRVDREGAIRTRFGPWVKQTDMDMIVVGVGCSKRAETEKPIV